jgi:hypothetical protein
MLLKTAASAGLANLTAQLSLKNPTALNALLPSTLRTNAVAQLRSAVLVTLNALSIISNALLQAFVLKNTR